MHIVTNLQDYKLKLQKSANVKISLIENTWQKHYVSIASNVAKLEYFKLHD